jgi:hypothetical protein
MIEERIGSLHYELNGLPASLCSCMLFGKQVEDCLSDWIEFFERLCLGNLSSIRVAEFVVALALKTISSSIPAYIGHRLDIPCEDVGRVMRLCISGFELFPQGGRTRCFY